MFWRDENRPNERPLIGVEGSPTLGPQIFGIAPQGHRAAVLVSLGGSPCDFPEIDAPFFHFRRKTEVNASLVRVMDIAPGNSA
jgi:hypothetical protein